MVTKYENLAPLFPQARQETVSGSRIPKEPQAITDRDELPHRAIYMPTANAQKAHEVLIWALSNPSELQL